mgnify:CR=1 FL=1
MPVLKKSFLDLPNKRSSHITPTPSGGGISFVIVATLSSLLYQNQIILLSLPLAIVGFYDDKKGIKPIYRFIIQILTCLSLIFISDLFWEIASKNNIYLIGLLFIILILSSGIINFVNFMDGTDGLVAACLLISFIVLVLNGEIVLIPFVGALLSFLVLNWSPAKIFMGDVGSTYLGALLVGFTLKFQSINEAVMFFMISFPLFFDTSTCVIRRLISKQPIFNPHKLHLYQRLHQAGWSHSKIALFYVFYCLLIAFCYMINNQNLMLFSIIIFVINAIYLDKNAAIKFNQLLRK